MLSHSLSRSLRKGRWKGRERGRERGGGGRGKERTTKGEERGRGGEDRNRRKSQQKRKFLFMNLKTLGMYMLTKLRVISFVEEQVITNTLQSKKNMTVKPVWRRMVGIYPVLRGAPPNL